MQDILSRGHVALLLEIAVSSHLAIEKNAVFYEGNQSVMPKSYGYVYRAQRRRFVRLGRYPSFRHCMVPNSLLESSGSEYALFFLLGVATGRPSAWSKKDAINSIIESLQSQR